MNLKDESLQDLLNDQNPNFAFLATVMKDGTPQVTPVWFNTDGTFIWINSALGRLKDRNMRARPAVALTISDRKNPYRYLQVRGRVVEITTQNAREHLDRLAQKYTGESYQGPQNTARVIYKILPEYLNFHVHPHYK